MRVNEDSLYKGIGERIRNRRSELGWSQARLADEIGLLRTSVTNIEKGRQRAPIHVIYDICATLRIDPSSLLPSSSDVAIEEPVPANITVQEMMEKLATGPKTTAFLAKITESTVSRK